MNATNYPLLIGALGAALLVAVSATTIHADDSARIPVQQLTYRAGDASVAAQEVRWGRRYYGGYSYGGPYGAYYGGGPYYGPGPRYYSGYRGFDGPYYGRGYRNYGGPYGGGYGYGYPYRGGVRVGGMRVLWR